MQDNYIAVHFQRSFHDMGGGRKSAVEFSSSSSSVRLHSHISSMMRLQFNPTLVEVQNVICIKSVQRLIYIYIYIFTIHLMISLL